MKISVITPTGDRPHFLKGTYELLKKQKHTDWEWLVYDTSLKPMHFDDPKVTYIHDEAIVSIGKKRERLVKRASGEIIVHFDDDDFYAPTYLQTVANALQECDFFNFHSWFAYDLRARQTYYWATDEIGQTQFILDPMTGAKVREIDFGPYMENRKEKANCKGKTGYGFSYAYKREVTNTCTFPDLDFGEDWRFYTAVLEAGYKVKMVADHKGEAVHVKHGSTTCLDFPQYRIPKFLLNDLFTDFFAHIEPYHED